MGRKLSLIHDQLRLAKDKQFVSLVNILPSWLLPNHVTIFRTVVILIWLPWAIFRPSVAQVLLWLAIYFLDLLDGAMARYQNRISYFGEYLDHLSDKFSNIAVLFVLYGVTGYQFDFFIFFIGWEVAMLSWLAVECVLRNKTISYFRSPFEFVAKIVLWGFLVFKTFPILFSLLGLFKV